MKFKLLIATLVIFVALGSFLFVRDYKYDSLVNKDNNINVEKIDSIKVDSLIIDSLIVNDKN